MHQAFDYGISTMELLLSGRTMGTEFLEWNLLSGRTMVLPGMSDALADLAAAAARCAGSRVGGEMELPRVVLCIRLLTWNFYLMWTAYVARHSLRMLLSWHRLLHFATPLPWHATLGVIAALCTDPMSQNVDTVATFLWPWPTALVARGIVSQRLALATHPSW